LRLLFAWVEDQSHVVAGHDGDLCGSLSNDHRVGTQVELRGYTAEQTAAYTVHILKQDRRARNHFVAAEEVDGRELPGHP